MLNKYLNIVDIQKFYYVNKLFRAASKFIIKQWKSLSRKVDFQISLLEKLLIEQNIMYCKDHPVLLSIYYFNKDKFQNQNIKFLKSFNCSITNCCNRCKTDKKQIFNLVLLLTYVPANNKIFEEALKQLSKLDESKIRSILCLLLQISQKKPQILKVILNNFKKTFNNYVYFFYKYILKKPYLDFEKQFKTSDDFFNHLFATYVKKFDKTR